MIENVMRMKYSANTRSAYKSKGFGPWNAVPNHMKACVRSLTRPTQFVRMSNIFVRNDF